MSNETKKKSGAGGYVAVGILGAAAAILGAVALNRKTGYNVVDLIDQKLPNPLIPSKKAPASVIKADEAGSTANAETGKTVTSVTE